MISIIISYTAGTFCWNDGDPYSIFFVFFGIHHETEKKSPEESEKLPTASFTLADNPGPGDSRVSHFLEPDPIYNRWTWQWKESN